MKKFFILAALIVLTISSTFADDLNSNIVNKLKSSFPSAVNIQWEIKDEFTVVEFSMDGQHLRTFYDNDGNFLGITKKIALAEVPVAYKTTIEQKFPGSVITEALVFNQAEKGSYQYISIAQPGKKTILQFDAKGHMSRFSVEKY